MRKTHGGSFTGDTLFKVRRISTGLFFKPEYRNPKWKTGGRAYKTLPAARTAAQNAAERDDCGGRKLIPPADLEIVEFHVKEAAPWVPS